MCAEDAPNKKPDPSVYRLALRALRVPAAAAVAIEDAPAGIEAATRAGIPVVVTRSHYFPDTADANALAAGPTLGGVQGWHPRAQPPDARITLAQIARWHARRPAARLPPAR
jgi:beta-phosphoglucomutase-like phosphatase (HAD superfamily)